MVQIQKYIIINGINVSSYVINWKIIETFGNEIPDCNIELSQNVSNVLTLENGQEIVIKRGPTTGQEYNVFKGNIDNINKNVPYFSVQGKGKLIQLVKREINTSYDKDIDSEAGVGSAIVNDMITTYGGLSTNSGATITSTGAVVLIQKFICKKTDIFERIRVLCDIYNYQIYYNVDDDYVYFEPIGYTTNSNILTVGSNVSNIPKWEFDNSQLVNQIRVEGAEQLVETTETGRIGVTTGYTTSGITLTQQPFSVKLYMDAVNPPTTLRTGGVENSTTTFYYSVDEINKKILPKSGTSFTGNDYAEIRYSYPQPVPILRKRQTSIDTYGLSSTTKHFSDIKTIEDATNRGDIYLNTYSTPFIRVQLNVPSISNNYKVGQQVQIVDNYNNEIRTLTITKIEKSFPHKYDILSCGDREYSISEYNNLTMNRIKRLEELSNKNDDILIQIIDFVDTSQTAKERYFKLQKQSLAGDTLIWGHPTYGIWNSYKWGNLVQASFILGHFSYGVLGTNLLGSNVSSAVTVKVIQGNMIYEEYGYDTDFNDVINSTATFSTVNKRISFTAGQVWYSNVIDLGTTINQVRITLGTVTGTLKYEISSDNKSTWQEITENTLTTVTSSDGLGTYLRITENAAGNAQIDLTTNTYNEVTEPIIKLELIE